LGGANSRVSNQSSAASDGIREKGGKAHAMPCHHNLETYFTADIHGAGLTDDPKGPLFRTETKLDDTTVFRRPGSRRI
jgi:hypothetical protein